MNVPKLRFKEFNDEWCKEYVGNLCSIQTGKSNTQDKTDDGIYPFYVRSPIIEKSHKFIFDTEAVLTVGDGVGVGKVFHYINGKFDCHQRVYMMNNFNKITAKYFYYIFSRDFDKRVMKMTAKTSVDSVRYEMIDKMQIFYPTVLEQNKISRTLELLDKKIELQSKKIEDLKLFKSSQIINFFNKNNFAEVYIKNIGFFQSGNSLSKDCLTSSGVPIILYGDLYTKYNEVIKKVEQYTNDNKKYVKSKQNQIIFPTSTTVNSLSLISPSSINLDGIIYGGDILILNLNKDVNADFLSYEINHYKKKEFSKIAQGSTIIHIHAEDLLNCKIALSNIVLQDKFALTFNKLNQKIELENNKLNKLQKLKKGLMQSMFV